jgi:PTH1 family peptidyl-tRNA hydrolase
MKLILAQGNPGPQYANTRHNIGWLVLDSYASKHGVSFRAASKFKADIAELLVGTEKAILMKPSTFYNLTGESAQAIASFYKIETSDILIVHDELALEFGTIRTRIGGSDAGNNGIKSVTAHLGPDTARVRIGIRNELAERIDSADFVLSRFTKTEAEALGAITQEAHRCIDAFLNESFEPTTIK